MDKDNPPPYVTDMEDQPMDRKEQERLLDQLECRYADAALIDSEKAGLAPAFLLSLPGARLVYRAIPHSLALLIGKAA